jgi:hypothetical protein
MVPAGCFDWVTPGKAGHHAYALYWSTPVSDWNAYYHYFQVFAATFQPAGP